MVFGLHQGYRSIITQHRIIKHKRPPINIDFKNRAAYYATLQAYEHNHNLKPTITRFMKEYAALKKELR